MSEVSSAMTARAPSQPTRLRRASGLAAITIVLPMLAACGGGVDRTVVSSIPTDDYRVRHPIVLAEDEYKLDVFITGGHGLDRRTAAQVAQFGSQYRTFGRGPIVILLPVGPRESTPATVAALREALAAGGARAPVSVTTYPIADPALASPVRLSYLGLKARIPHGCGEWPSDLGSGPTVDEWGNHPYWNMGCATQTALTAQVADPRDLAAPQADAPADTVMRSRAIESVRKGVDPATDWKFKNSSISSVGGS